MKRFLTSLAAIFLSLSLVGQASAFTVTGGTAEQRVDVFDTIVAMDFPTVFWVESKIGSVSIEILDSYPPYWTTALGVNDDVLVDVFSAQAAGVAWPGNIKIHSAYVPGTSTFFREIVSHEWSHEVWFALLAVPGASVEWKTRVEEGLTPNPAVWTQNYVESHAEQLRVASWTSLYYLTLYPRTDLNRLGNEAVREFHARWTSTTTTTTPVTTTTSTTAPPPPPTTTTTTPRGDPWPDVAREDTELWEAAWWARDNQVLLGYVDGTLGPYNLLSHRHISFIVDRWVGIGLDAQWMDDYSPVTRAEVRDALPGLIWLEARWTEPLTRGQLVRLMWRAR